ncbi:hypothetical protein A7E78_11075 [Syntrophotalea acetylenivorans]|uniref:DUF2339 domain-containing protein n=1 Tax=Syntrophotalea acetylenivorans TaxID=1842532 RepID=A0A1L3GQZ6_9BACT|nr:DUF2339 domain-containing protein [Syntrophotalea acetylenivorans]APG28344.1 hypothetical protein A7E78_11075 [Syntrophotalea acetylenivorans]
MLLLFLALAVFVLVQFNALRQQNRVLAQRLSQLEALVKQDAESAEKPQVPNAETAPVTAAEDFAFETIESNGISVSSAQKGEPAKKVKPAPAAPLPKYVVPNAAKTDSKPAVPSFWKKVERQFLENWTGILGAVIMVMGVAFLGGYAYLQMIPFHRFLLLIAFAALLMGLFTFLRSKPQWLKLALWLRSSASAILLFACLGAGGFPALQWLTDPLAALVLLCLGIAVNLYLGFIGGRQAVAAIHVVLSLAALAAAPPTHLILIIAALVTLYGIALTYRDKWDYHLLLTISSFFVFHLSWYVRTLGGVEDARRDLLGLAVVVAVGVLAALVHYRQVYKSREFVALPFVVHLLNWLYFGFGLLCYAQGTLWKTFFLAGGGVLAFGLARCARRVPVRWLYLTDTLVAKLLLVLALVSLNQWQVGYVVICSLVVFAGLLFAVLAAVEEEELLFQVGSRLAQLAGLILILLTCLSWPHADDPQRYSNALWLGLCALASTVLHRTVGRKEQRDQGVLPVMQFLAGIMAVALYFQLHLLSWAEYGLLLAVPLFYLRERNQDEACGGALLLFLLGVHGIFWIHFSPADHLPWGLKTIHALPLLVLAGAAIRWSWHRVRQKHYAWIGIYLMAGNLFLISYDLGRAYSPLIPGVVWLLLSLAALELSTVIRRRRLGQSDCHLLYVGHAYVVAFLVRYFMVHVPSEAYLGTVSVRLLVEFLGLAVLMYWALQKRPTSDSGDRNWSHLMPLYAEATLLLTVFVLLLELNEFWYPLCWMGLGYLCLMVGWLLKENFSRLRVYSLLFSWAAAFYVAFLTSSYVVPSDLWYRQAWFAATITILLQLPYGYLVCARKALQDIAWPISLHRLARPADFFRIQIGAWVFYPLFAAVAVFLYWTFDLTILTLLWVVEAFVIFAFSLLLRADHFRYVALSVIGVCLLRLVFYDLSHAGTLTRALVFLGVGIVMLLIHALFNQFKGRVTDG